MRVRKRESKSNFKNFFNFFQTIQIFSYDSNVLKLSMFSTILYFVYLCLTLFTFVYLCSNDASMHNSNLVYISAEKGKTNI